MMRCCRSRSTALGALVPVDDALLQVALDDGVLRLVQQRGLVPQALVRGLALDFGRGAGGEDLQRGGHEIHLLQRLAEQHEHHAYGLARGVAQLQARIGLGLQLLHHGRLRVVLGQARADDELALVQQLDAGCAFERVHLVGVEQAAIAHHRQRLRQRPAAALRRGNEARHAARLRAQGLAHVARQLLEELGPRGRRDGRSHLEHRGLQALLLAPCAQAHDAVGQVVGQLLQELFFFRAQVQHLGGVQLQQAEAAPLGAQRQGDQPAQAAPGDVAGPGAGRGHGAQVGHDGAAAAAHGLPLRALAARVGGRPGEVELVDEFPVLPGAGGDAYAVLCVVLGKARPGEAVAAHVHHQRADGLQQGLLGAGAHQRLAATAEHALRARQALELALGALALGDVRAHGLARGPAAEVDAVRPDLHLAHRAVAAAVAAHQQLGARVGGGRQHLLAQGGALLGQPQIVHAHGEQLLLAVAVQGLHGLVHGEKAQRCVLGVHPHGLGMGVEQQPVLLLGLLQLRGHLAQAQHGAQGLRQDLQVRRVARAKGAGLRARGLDGADHASIGLHGHGQHGAHLLALVGGAHVPALGLGVVAQHGLALAQLRPQQAVVHGQHAAGAAHRLACGRAGHQGLAFEHLQQHAAGLADAQRRFGPLLQHLGQREVQRRDALLHLGQLGMGTGFGGVFGCGVCSRKRCSGVHVRGGHGQSGSKRCAAHGPQRRWRAGGMVRSGKRMAAGCSVCCHANGFPLAVPRPVAFSPGRGAGARPVPAPAARARSGQS